MQLPGAGCGNHPKPVRRTIMSGAALPGRKLFHA
jgi:hypothetical protein